MNGRRSISIILGLVFLSMASACATSFDKRGRYHKVRSGESIWTIARAYRVDVQDLAEFNNIFDSNQVEAGTKMYIPEREKRTAFKQLPADIGEEAPKRRIRRPSKYREKGEEDYSKPIKTFRGKFIWPVDNTVISPFGIRNGRRHDGIDIKGRDGTPIKAAAAGRVVFSGKMRGYGNLILIRHEDNYFTAYAHNQKNKAKEGQNVKQGHVVALVGRTGRATGSHLHFEIRHGQKARNPLFFLPERK